MIKILHDMFQFAFSHLAMGHANTCFWNDFFKLCLHSRHGAHLVMEEIDLSTPADFTQEAFADLPLTPFSDKGANGQSMLWWRGDDGYFTQTR